MTSVAPSIKRTGFARTMQAVVGRAYPRVIGSNRDRSWLFYDTVLPLLGTIAFVYVYKAIGAPERFIGYVIMGGATTAFWLNVMWGMASQFYWDKQAGNLELYMVAPCGLAAILVGMSVGGLLATLVRATAIVLVGSLLFGVQFVISDYAAFLLVFGLGLVGLYTLGMCLASLFLMWGRETWHLVDLFMEPIFLVSGFYFPVSALGWYVGLAASIVPLTLALDALRQILFPDEHPAFLPMQTELAILAVLALLFAVVAKVLLREMETRARREGRLSLRF
jgi:ABC-2 type transport system permease protein